MSSNVLKRLRFWNHFNNGASLPGALILDLCGTGHGCASFRRTVRLAAACAGISLGPDEESLPAIDCADFEERLSDLNRHAVNIVHAHPRLAIHSTSLDEVLRGRKNMAYWNDIIPFLDCGGLYDEPFDEIWVPSQFMAAVVRPRTTLPVHVFPYAVDSSSSQSSQVSRSDFGVDSKETLFLARVDLRTPFFFSNPGAVIEAFREAFAFEGVARMILLLENPDHDPAVARELQTAAGGGVLVVDSHLTSEDVRSLLRTTDVYLSLHRLKVDASDILDAMAEGVPVIATGFSANMEFMNERNTLLSGFRKRLLTVKEARDIGLFSVPEFEIAEPDLLHAASLMRELADASMSRGALRRSSRRTAETLAHPRRAAQVLGASIDTEKPDLQPREDRGTSSQPALRLTVGDAPALSVTGPGHSRARAPAGHMLVLTPYVPAPDTYGGGVTIWNNWRSFRELYPEVSLTVLYFCMQPQDLGPSVLNWTVRLGVLHVFCGKTRRESSRRFNLYPRPFRQWLAKSDALMTVARDLRQNPDSIFVSETILCAPYFPSVQLECPRVLILHDDFQKTFRQFWKRQPWYRIDRKWIFILAWYRMRQLHAFALEAFSHVAFVSEDDARTLRPKQGTGTTASFPLTIDCRRIRSQAEGVETRPRRVGFVGFFPYWPNVTAVEWMMKQVFPALRREFPDAQLHVFGSEPPKSWARPVMRKRGLVIRGFQPEIYRELAQCEVIVNPLFEGTGTRTKLLEAFALGKAVVSTSTGVQGVAVRNGRDCLIADTAEEFTAAISRLLLDFRLREFIGENARQLADRHDGPRVVSAFWSDFEATVSESEPNDRRHAYTSLSGRQST